jgi:two-component system CheB/CheR fusion protein
VSVNVLPLEASASRERYFIMLFEDGGTARPPAAPVVEPPSSPGAPTSDDLESENRRLRQALATQQEYQQTIIEKLESANEELRSSHEEVLSANEELQSTNEEMQTAKEELQSSNEELLTLNDELRSRNAELGQANNDLHNVLTSVQIPMAIVDTMLRIRRITPSAEELLSVAPSSSSRKITDFKPQVDIPNLEALLHTSIDNLSTIEQEVKDRQGKWWMLRIRPYRTMESKIDGAVLTLMDVDQLKRSAIQTEERRLFSEALVESMRDPFLVLSGRFQVKQWNDAFLRFFQIGKEDVEGKFLFQMGSGQWDLPALRTLLRDVLPKKSLFKDFQVERDFPGIGRKILLLRARQVEVTQADEPMILLTFEDVTERKDNERHIRDLNQGLERKVSERTSTLESAKGELEAFTYCVALDLRAPLRAMSGFSETLLQDYDGRPLDEAGKKYLRRIIAASRKMDTLILDLLSFSRLTREETPLEPVDLSTAVQEVLEELSGEIQSRRAELKVSPPLPRVLAHPPTLGQVLTNLLANALKFVAPGTTPRVLIRAEERGPVVRLWIEDNGIGIAEHHQERIFRVFERLNKTEDYPGTGIGLALVKKSMERMRGRVGFESQVDRGSRFWVEFLRDSP